MINLVNCPISGEPLNELISLGDQPVFMGTTSELPSQDRFHQMSWGYTDTGVVHLVSRIPLEELYSQSHNSGLIGKVWRNHHTDFANFIAKFQPQKICEIGGGHGILSSQYSQYNAFSSWEIFEPNASGSTDHRVIVKNELFTHNSKVSKKDCFVHSHLFEHLYDHSDVLSNVYESLKTDGLMIFSLPNMRKMLEGGYINALNFEHVTYLPEDLVEHILALNGFRIIEKKYYLEDHSIFFACQKTDYKSSIKYENKENINDVKKFYQKLFTEIDRINIEIESKKHDQKIYLFGAHIFSQFYINNGLNIKKISFILDNDEKKQNQRLYGTKFKVAHPNIIMEDTKPVVLLKVGAYRSEILSQLQALNSKVEIIE